MTLTIAAPAIIAAFLASFVEAVEALTIVLAVASVRGWRPAGLGALGGLSFLVLIVLAFGRLLTLVPLGALQLAIGVLLLLFGMRWLRKAVLRASGILRLHDEAAEFSSTSETLRGPDTGKERRPELFAMLVSFKAVVLEGLEVVFIVIAIGAGRGLLAPAGFGAFAACALVAAVGFVVRRPLAQVPENVLKFAVGIMLSSFGVFWIGEAIGVPWPGGDLAIPGIVALFLMAAAMAVGVARRRAIMVAP